jgi:hypothetical protein
MDIDLLTSAEKGAALTQSEHDANFTDIQTAINDLKTVVVSVKERFGAVGDGTTDDLAALTAASTSAANNGHDLFLPRGVYRVTGTWVIGGLIIPIANLYKRTDAELEAGFYDTSVVTAFLGKYRPKIMFEAGAAIWGDFNAGATTTPIMYYGFQEDYGYPFGAQGAVIGARLVGRQGRSGGAWVLKDQNEAPIIDANQVGLVATIGCAEVSNLRMFHLGQGLVSPNAYWQQQRDIRTYLCGKGVQNIRFNAGTLIGYKTNGDDDGLILDGEAWTARGVHSQNTQRDIWVKTCESSVLEFGYLEDVVSGASATDYSLRLGMTDGGVEIIGSSFIGGRLGGSVVKKALYAQNAANCLLVGIRCTNSSATMDLHTSCRFVTSACYDLGTAQVGPIAVPLENLREGPKSIKAYGAIEVGSGGVTATNTSILQTLLANEQHIVIDQGIFDLDQPLVPRTGQRIEGRTRYNSRLRNAVTDMFDIGSTTSLIEFVISDLWLESLPGGGHIFDVQGGSSFGVVQSQFHRLFLLQDNNGKSIVNCQGLWLDVDFYHGFLQQTATSTVPAMYFEDQGGCININRFHRLRCIYAGVPFFRFLNKSAGAYSNQNTFDQINFEVTPGGIFDLAGVRDYSLRDIGIYDMGTSTDDLIKLRRGDNGGSAGTGLNSTGCMFDNVKRVGGTLGVGLYDYKISGSSFNYAHMIRRPQAAGGSACKIDAANGYIRISDYTTATIDNGGYAQKDPLDFEATEDMEVTGNFTFGYEHIGRRKIVRYNSASAITGTIPLYASAGIPIGTTFTVVRHGAGAANILGTSGVTINGDATTPNIAITTQYHRVSLWQVAADVWIASASGAVTLS